MKPLTRAVLLLFMFSWVQLACTTGAGNDSQQATSLPEKKILTIGGTISEIVSALGMAGQIVATDRTSVYPESLQQLPSVGYRNSIKAEGVLSTGAELILAETNHFNPDVATQLQTAGVDFHSFTNTFSLENTKAMILKIAAITGKEGQAKAVIASLKQDVKKANELLKNTTNQPKVMFVYARGKGTMSVCGTGTFAESIIALAGGRLATPEIEGFKPLTPEALIAADPDYILFFDSGLQSLGGVEGTLEIQGVGQTKAGKNRNIIAMDGLYLSGFGPRVGKAIYDLARLIHPELQTNTLSNKQ